MSFRATLTETGLQRAQSVGAAAVIQVGDFGYGWRFNGDDTCHFTDKVSKDATEAGVPVWWIDGNHENFDHLTEIGAFDSKEPFEVAPNVIHIPRGTILHLGDQ
jgi:hypothetical protein